LAEIQKKESSRGRPRSLKSWEAIRQATRDLLLESGYSRLTLEAVATRSGTGKATIYRWWSSKGELALDAAKSEISIGVVPDHGNTRDDVSAAIEQLIETFSRPLASVVIFAAITTLDDDPKMAQIFRDDVVYPWRESAAEAIQRGISRGDIAHSDTQFVLDVIVGTVFQRTLVLKEPQTAELAQSLLAMIVRTK
jgi:AcrR family transcriptional regulator